MKEHEYIIKDLLKFIGEDPDREGLIETPNRVLKAFKNYWCRGYDVDIEKLFKVFEDGAENYDELIILQDIPVYSLCEHHICDIIGVAHIGYIPNKKIIGLSKFSRVVDAFARRLQVQERLTTQIANAINTYLQPKGCGVIICATHACMATRGICQPGILTTTSALHGVLLEKDNNARLEFLSLLNKK